MVLLKTTLAGVAVLVLGILLVTFLGQYITMEVQDVQRQDVEPHAEFLVGDVADRSYTLPGGVSVSGSIAVTQASTNSAGDIHFLVFDDQDYQRWSSGGQANFVFSADKQGQFNFAYSTDKGGVYHFVFDNRASLFKKYVVLSVGYDEVTISRVPDTRVRTLGLGVLMAGGLVLVLGLVKKAPVPWA
jgi:hypothetical protein